MPGGSIPTDAKGQLSQIMNTTHAKHDVVNVLTSGPVLLNPPGVAHSKLFIQNFSQNTGTIYIGESDVAATGGRRGVQLTPGQSFDHTVSESIPTYAIATGANCDVHVMRLH